MGFVVGDGDEAEGSAGVGGSGALGVRQGVPGLDVREDHAAAVSAGTLPASAAGLTCGAAAAHQLTVLLLAVCPCAASSSVGL